MPAGPRTTPYPVVVQFSDPTNPTTPVKLLESSSLFVNNLSAVTISATNYLNLPNIGGVTSVNQLDGTGIFVLSSTNNSLSSLVSNIQLSTVALSAYIAANESSWAAITSIDLTPYVLTSVNSALSSTVTGHIANETIHFTSGSLSSAYALSSWVSDNFIDNTEITQYATTGSLLPYALTASLSNYLLTSVNVTSLEGTSIFETTSYARINYATTGQLNSYVLTSTNLSLSSTVTGHIADASIHFTSGSLSSAYALSSWVSNNFIDNTEITQYATTGSLLPYALTASLSNYLVTSVNVTSLAGTSTFETTGYARVNYATTGQLQSYVLTSTNLSLSSTVTGHIADSSIHFTSGSLSSAYALSSWVSTNFIDNTEITQYATTASLTNYLLTSVNVTSLAGTGVFALTGTIPLSSLTDVTITNPQQYQVLTWNGTKWQPSSVVAGGPATSPGGSTNDLQYNAGGGSFGGTNGLTWTAGSQLLSAVNIYSVNASAATISATNYLNLPNFATTATNVTSFQGTGVFETTSYARINYATTGQLQSYVLTSTNLSLSSTVTGHIADGTIHFTSGSLSSAYALSSWVSNNFIDNTEITAYATTASLSNYLLTSVNVTSLAGTSTFETTGYARVNYATTGQLQSYVLTSTNASLSSTVTGHIADETIHFTSGSLSSAYALSSWVSNNFIDNTEILQYATTASLTNYLLTSVNVTSLAGTSTFETTGYARVNYATTGQLQSYVLTSTNLSLSTLVTNHLGSSVHWELSTLNNNYINASGDSANAGFYLSSVSAINISATNYYNLPSASFPWDEAYTVVLYVKNNSASVAIPKGTPVAIVGAAGDTPKVSPLSSVNNHVPEAIGFSNHVAGLAQETIAADGFGHIVVEGILEGTGGAGSLNTDQFAAGDWLYVSSNGQLAATRPPAPYESHPVGIVLRPQLNTGKILVKIENVPELNDIVGFNLSPTLINGDLISYDLTTSTFKNVQALNISGGSRFGSVSSTNISATNYLNLPSGTPTWNANQLSGVPLTYNGLFDLSPLANQDILIYTDPNVTGSNYKWMNISPTLFGANVGSVFDANKLRSVNVTATAPTNKQALVYDNTGTSWKPTTLNLSTSLNDVQITTAANDSVLSWSATAGKWVPRVLASVAAKNLYELQDVDPNTVPPSLSLADYALLQWNSTNSLWEGVEAANWINSVQSNIDHNSLANLPIGNPHTQYATLSGATFTGQVRTPSVSATSGLFVTLSATTASATTYLNLPSGVATWNANKIQDVSVSSTNLNRGDVLTYDGTVWRPVNIAGPSMLISQNLITG